MDLRRDLAARSLDAHDRQALGEHQEAIGRINALLETRGQARARLEKLLKDERAPRSTTMPGGSKCFWTGAGQPINPIGDPYMVYKDLFGGLPDTGPMTDPAAVKRLMVQKKSILDYLGSSLEQFKARLGTDDKEAVELLHA